jgi:hypothetical protein
LGSKFCEKTGAWLDNYIIEYLEHGKKAVAAKWDFITVIDGVEGSGKSGLAFTSAYYLDRSFNVNNIVFTPEQFIEAVDNSKPGQAIVWDEFVLGGLSDDAMKTIQTTIIKKMVTIRKKRLYIFLVIPFIFMLRPYFAVGRTRMLIHTSTPDGIRRGFWKLYNYERKKDVYLKGKKFYEYKVPPNRRGDFGNAENWGFIDWKVYQEKKDDATLSINILDGRKQESRYRVMVRRLVHYLKRSVGEETGFIAELTGLSERQVQRFVKAADTDPNVLNNPDNNIPGEENII